VQHALTSGTHEGNLVCVGLLGARVDDAVGSPFTFDAEDEIPAKRTRHDCPFVPGLDRWGLRHAPGGGKGS
jgi:hypothetical protein